MLGRGNKTGLFLASAISSARYGKKLCNIKVEIVDYLKKSLTPLSEGRLLKQVLTTSEDVDLMSNKYWRIRLWFEIHQQAKYQSFDTIHEPTQFFFFMLAPIKALFIFLISTIFTVYTF